MYVNYGYYEAKYLCDREPVVLEDDFRFWEKQAARVVDQYTFGRLASNSGLVTGDVKECICELTELLYQADKIVQQAGMLQSYSNDGESGTFDLSQSTFTEDGKTKKIREIIHRYLGNTNLLYRGV